MARMIPVPDEVSKPFWDAANQRRLVVQNCTACKRVQYPPQKACAQCGSEQNLEWRQLSGQGKILDYIVVHDSRMRAWQAVQPYNVAIINPDDAPELQFFSNLPGTPADKVPVGASVRVEFEEVAPGQLIPEWRVAS